MHYIIAILVIAALAVGFTLFQTNREESQMTEEVIVPEIVEIAETEEPPVETAPEPTQEIVPVDTPTQPQDIQSGDESSASSPATENTSAFTDGSYTTEASYFTPRRTRHDMDITLTLENGVVVDANILYDGETPQTPSHRGFDDAYKTVVIGESIETISLSRVGGASLTSNSFNEAVAEIKAQAQS